MDATITSMKGFKPSRGLDRDKLAMTPRPQATRVAHAALAAIQKERPEQFVMGVATLFAATCRRCRIEPKDLAEMGRRILDVPFEGDAPTSAHVEVLRDFIGGAVMGEEVTIS